MTVSAPLPFPGSRTLAGWWRQLTPWQPRALWVGHLLLHRIEALSRRTQLTQPDPFHLLMLKALALAPPPTLAALAERLHLDRQVIGQVLRTLTTEGLVEGETAPALTALGREALARGEYPQPIHERRVFYFVDGERADGAPSFLSLTNAAPVPWPATADWRFDVTLLAAGIAQSEEWKRQHGFPLDVEQVFDVQSDAPAAGQPEAWRRVILDRPERLAIALVRSDNDRLLGFTIRQDGWSILTDAPILNLGPDWAEVFPRLTEAAVTDWQQAWRTWCQPRGLAEGTAEAVNLRHEGHRLRVTVSAPLLEHLRATRSEALKGEAWVLMGSGTMRAAAVLEIVAAEKAATQDA